MSRNWNILSWIFLTAGIVLGGWWSYMELGWGGYWAWDPWKTLPLIPWFAGTAVLHTAVIETRRNALQRTNVFLMSLTFLLCIFSTYLTRSGVIDSLHTFGESGVAQPLFWAMVGWLAVTLMVVFLSERLTYRTLSDFLSRQGMLVMRPGSCWRWAWWSPGYHVAGHQPDMDHQVPGAGRQFLQPRLPAVHGLPGAHLLLLSLARLEGRHP